jgi:hypothetical protein
MRARFCNREFLDTGVDSLRRYYIEYSPVNNKQNPDYL